MITALHKEPYDFKAGSGNAAWWPLLACPQPQKLGCCSMWGKNDCWCQSSIRCAFNRKFYFLHFLPFSYQKYFKMAFIVTCQDWMYPL